MQVAFTGVLTQNQDAIPMSDSGAFRILSLNGGGARGIFQARFLEHVEDRLGTPLADSVDLVGATSTGALVGLAVANRISMRQVRLLYEAHAELIFKARRAAAVRRGPRYSVDELERHLTDLFGVTRMSELDVPAVITSSTVDTHQHKLFDMNDRDVRVVDVALASAAAPTYFAPRRIEEDRRGFYDGGLWANDPSAVTLSYARDNLGIDASRIRMLMIGTGKVPGGTLASELDKLRPVSLKTLEVVWEMTGSLQSSAAQRQVGEVLPESNRLLVDPDLRQSIALDDAKKSLAILPSLADAQFEDHREKVRRLLAPGLTANELIRSRAKDANPTAARGIAEANLLTFVPSRKFYSEYRSGHGSISEYISLAKREITIVSVNLMTAESWEDILKTVRKILTRPDASVRVTISLLHPDHEHLMKAIAGSLRLDPEDISKAIRKLTDKAAEFRDSLPDEAVRRFTVHWHRSLPSASAILSDAFEPDGRIQLETRAYDSPMADAFGFEVGYGSQFFETLRTAYHKLIKDGVQIVPPLEDGKSTNSRKDTTHGA